MNTSLSMNDIYAMLATLNADNKKWLATKLMEDAETAMKEESVSKKKQYRHKALRGLIGTGNNDQEMLEDYLKGKYGI